MVLWVYSSPAQLMKKLTFTTLCKIDVECSGHFLTDFSSTAGTFWPARYQLCTRWRMTWRTPPVTATGHSRPSDLLEPILAILPVCIYKSEASKCDLISSSGSIWETGKKLFNYIRKQTFEGRTGRVAFDAMGDRVFAEYKIINIKRTAGAGPSSTPKQVTVGNYSYHNVISR